MKYKNTLGSRTYTKDPEEREEKVCNISTFLDEYDNINVNSLPFSAYVVVYIYIF